MGSMMTRKPPDTRNTPVPRLCNRLTSSGMPAAVHHHIYEAGYRQNKSWNSVSQSLRTDQLPAALPLLMRGGCAARNSYTFCREVCMMFRRCLSASWKSTVPPMALQHPSFFASQHFPVLMMLPRCHFMQQTKSLPCSYLAVMAATSSPTPRNAASSSIDSSSHLYPARCQGCKRMSSHMIEGRLTEAVLETYSVLSTSKQTACSQHWKRLVNILCIAVIILMQLKFL